MSDPYPPPPDLLAELRDGAWLDAQQFPPLGYAVPRIVPEGLTLLAGPPKIGKSWLVLSLALGVASGGRALGAVVDKRPVLLLALEDGDRRLQDRCHALLHGEPIPPRLHYLTRVRPGLLLDTIGCWLEQEHDEPPLVILDTLGKAALPAQAGESSYERDYRIGSSLKRLADQFPGSALLCAHHDRKAAASDFVDTVSGTHGLAGSADTVITLTRPRHEQCGLLRVTGRDVDECAYAVCLHQGGSWQLDGADLDQAAARAGIARATDGVGDRMSEIIRYIGECPNGATPGAVVDALGIDAGQVGTYLKRALEAGRLVKPKRGLYTVVSEASDVSLITPGDDQDL